MVGRRYAVLIAAVAAPSPTRSACRSPGKAGGKRQLVQLLPLDVEGVDRIDYVFPADSGYMHYLIDAQGEADNRYQIYPDLGPLLGLDDLTTP